MQIVIDNLIRCQRDVGHDVQLLTRWKSAKTARDTNLGYPVLALPPNPMFAPSPFKQVGPRAPVEAAIAWHQWRNQFDLFHVHFLYPTGWLAHRILRRLEVPMVATAHGGDINFDTASGFGYRQYPKHDRRLHELGSRLDTVTAITDSMAETLSDLGVKRSAIKRIDNGIEFGRFEQRRNCTTSTRAAMGIPENAVLILSAGRNQASKGFDIIPKVLAELVNEERDVYWVVAGSGVEDLGESFADSSLGDRIILKDSSHFKEAGKFPSDSLIDLFVSADLFAFPSHNEGMGLVALEAMAAGTPVVGNNVPGIRDTISHEANGLLVEPKNVTAMAQGLRRLLDDAALRGKCVDAGLEKAAQSDWSNIAGQYLGLYEELVGNK